jgi:hypothetical protein
LQFFDFIHAPMINMLWYGFYLHGIHICLLVYFYLWDVEY